MNRRAMFLVIFAYCLISLIYTYPLIFNMNRLGGNPSGGADSPMFAWNLWWLKHSLLNLHVSTFKTDWLFYPIGADLTYHTLSIFNGIISIPLQFIFSLTMTYNIILFLTFLLSAVTAFFLIYYLIENIRAAFIGGMIFSFTPYHFAHASAHLNFATIQFLPLIVLCLFKLFNKPNIKNSIFFAISLILNFYSCYYYAIYVLFFIIMFVFYLILIRRMNLAFVRYFSIGVIIFMIGIAPMLVNFIGILGQKDVYIHCGEEYIYVADLVSFFIPHPNNFISQALGLLPIYQRFTGFNCPHETIRFVGYIVIFLSLLAIVKTKFSFKWFWVFIATFFFTISLGPHLHILGKTYFPSIKMPFYWLIQKAPFIKNARIPSRAAIMLVLSLTILASYGYSYLERRIKNKITKYIVFGIASCLLLFELYCGKFPQININIPMFYRDIALDKSEYAILDFPINVGHAVIEKYMFYQTVHNKKICNGRLSRCEPREDVWNKLKDFKKDELIKNDIRYIVVHPDSLSKEDMDYYTGLFDGRFKKIDTAGSEIVVYKVNS